MATITQERNQINEMVVSNGGNGGKGAIEVQSPQIERVAYASSTSRLPAELIERHLSKMDAFVDTLVDRTNQYVNNAIEKSKKGPSAVELEIAAPIGPVFPLYPWWNLLVVGPFQGLGLPPAGPFLPNKVIQAAPTFIWTILWRNPAPIDWVFGNPSAAQVMNGRNYSLWAEMINLTNVTNGPDINIAGTFAVGGFMDAQLLVFTPPTPPQGKPDLYELNVTVDVTAGAQPMAGFASWVLDLDTEPAFLNRPLMGPQWQYERPVRFMVYRP